MRLRSTRLSSIGQGSGGRSANLSLSWAVDSAGNWSVPANWGSGVYYPNSSTDTATLGTIITANRIVTLDIPVTLLNLNIGDDQNYTLSGSQILSFASGSPTLTITSTGTPTISCPISLGAALALSNTPASTISGIISGSFGFTKSGAGNLTLSGVNTFQGTLSLSAGQILCGVAGALNSNVDVSLANTAGVALDLNGFDQTVKSIAGGGVTGGNLILGAKTLTIAGSATSTLTGVVSGTGGNITLTGATVLTLAGVNTLTGNITCSSTGTIKQSSTTGLGTATIFLVNGSTFGKITGNLTNANVNAISMAGTITIDCTNGSNYTFGTGAITLTGDTEVNVSVSGSTFTSTGLFNGNNSYKLTKSGLGTLSIGGGTPTTNYTDAYILNGTLAVTNSASLPSGTVYLGDTSGSNSATFNCVAGTNKPVTVRSGSSGTKTIKRNSGSPTISGLITLQTDVTMDGNGGNMTFTAGTTGTGNVTYTNSGTGTLSISTAAWNHSGSFTTAGASTGAITQSVALGSNVTNLVHGAAGTYVCNGTNSNTGTVSVNSGIFGGTGTSKGAMTVASGATLQGGGGDTSSGTLNSNGDVTLNTGAISRHGINTGAVSKVAVTGNLTFNGNTVNFPASALNAGTYTLYTYTGSQSGTLTMGTLPTGRTFSSFSYSAGSVTVTFT